MRAMFQAGKFVIEQSNADQPLPIHSAVDAGAGPEANRASVPLWRKVKSELSVPPCETSFLNLSTASLRPHA